MSFLNRQLHNAVLVFYFFIQIHFKCQLFCIYANNISRHFLSVAIKRKFLVSRKDGNVNISVNIPLKNLLKGTTEMRSYQIIRYKMDVCSYPLAYGIFYHFLAALSHLVAATPVRRRNILAMEKSPRELIAT